LNDFSCDPKPSFMNCNVCQAYPKIADCQSVAYKDYHMFRLEPLEAHITNEDHIKYLTGKWEMQHLTEDQMTDAIQQTNQERKHQILKMFYTPYRELKGDAGAAFEMQLHSRKGPVIWLLVNLAQNLRTLTSSLLHVHVLTFNT